jgi:hypothetical protein
MVEKLDETYLDSAGEPPSFLDEKFHEANIYFKRGGRYYAVAGAQCGYCPGSTSFYAMASSPLGPWKDMGPFASDNCGGQDTHVEDIGGTLLFMSDLWRQDPSRFTDGLPTEKKGPKGEATWEHFYTNQAQANYYWGQLSFEADGRIKPVDCAQSLVQNPFVISPERSRRAPADLDRSSGVDGFSIACDVGTSSGAVSRMQSFRASRSGLLSALSITTFQGSTDGDPIGQVVRPDADLALELVELESSGKILKRLGSFIVERKNIGMSPRKTEVRPGLPVDAGKEYAFVLRSSVSAASPGCYGFAYKDTNDFPFGRAFLSRDGGRTFVLESGRALKFETRISAPR